MTTTITKRPLLKSFAAIAVIICGLLMAVLAPAGGATSSWRIVGFIFLACGAAWLGTQMRQRTEQGRSQAPATKEMTLIQSPLLWVPIVMIVIALLVFLLN